MDLISGIILVAVLVVAIFFFVRDKRINRKVLKNSPQIAALLLLNQEIGFHNITDSFYITKHYDSKSSYNKIEPAYLMASDIRANIAFYSEYASQLKENRSNSFLYKEKTQELLQKNYEIDYAAIGLSKNTFLRHQKRLFKKRILTPVIDCTFSVTMTYSSPKGKVNLSKEACFMFDDLFACLGSVSRSRLDRNMYRQLALVERGEVSDSLRYDILNRDNFKCTICGASANDGARLHVDHIVPIAKGGKSVPENLRTLCERCNIGKSDKIETASQQSSFGKTNSLVCGYCGSALVLRKGRYGDFYGCINYPACKFTQDIEK